MKYTDFFNEVYEIGGISKLWLKMLDMLKRMEIKITDATLNVFTIYFALLDEGNTCICLDSQVLLNKWNERWEGLKLIAEVSDEDTLSIEDFKKEIEEGVSKISILDLPNLISEANDLDNIDKPFVICSIEDKNWLFITKFFEAKTDIEDKVRKIFKSGPEQTTDREALSKKLSSLLSSPFVLNAEQLDAVVRGQKENLIITGGPGTGKTTVICFILWELLHQEEYQDYVLYLAAPSGKAGDRMKESILESLNDFKDEYKKDKVFEKLEAASSHTIHKLLSYKPKINQFSFNKNNQFEEKSIFVIDEASMIDLVLFKSLLNAIPENARLFILGDRNQLPSVQAGAVLGELLEQSEKKNNIVHLVESKRFNAASEVGVFSCAMQTNPDEIDKYFHFESWKDWSTKNQFIFEDEKDKYPVEFIQLEENKPKKNQINEIITEWAEVYYAPLIKNETGFRCDNIEKSKENIESYFETLFDDVGKSRILCAERRGNRGVEYINNYISSLLREKFAIEDSLGQEFIPGELLMLTQNQSMYDLNNGDSGIVVKFKDDPIEYMMIEKRASDEESNDNVEKKGIFSIGKYTFFPLYLIPKEAIELSYAITVHKAQGSGYNNILCFIPEVLGHPLLNRQIVYTAITRTKGRTYLISTPEALKKGINTKISRDTKISL